VSDDSPETRPENADWRRLYPFKSNWLALPGGRMHFLNEGSSELNGAASRETLLFVHGNPTWSFHWRRLILALRDHYRCVAPDHLGCGLSDKPQRYFRLDEHIDNLVALVEHLRLDNITLIAQDWGGAIGLGAVLRMRERLRRIVLFNTGAFPPRYIPWRIRVCRWPVVGPLAVRGANAFSRAALPMTLARRSRLEPEVEAGYLAPYDSWANRCAVYGFVKDIPDPKDSTDVTWVRLAAIEQELSSLAGRPICLVWGMRDWCFRPDCLDRFLEAWPNAEAHRLPDVGHWVLEDAPEESLSIVRNFLASRLEIEPQRHEESNVMSTQS
jgi:haloalkane dehalogenase